jgi:hypothetical protein
LRLNGPRAALRQGLAYVYQSIVQGVIILLALAAGVFVARRTQ